MALVDLVTSIMGLIPGIRRQAARLARRLLPAGGGPSPGAAAPVGTPAPGRPAATPPPIPARPPAQAPVPTGPPPLPARQIGRAHVRTTVTNAPLVRRIQLEKKIKSKIT